MPETTLTTVGSIAGFDIRVMKEPVITISGRDYHYYGYVEGRNTYKFSVNLANPTMMFTSISATLKNIEGEIKSREKMIAEAEKDIGEYEKIAASPFEKLGELVKTQTRLDEIMFILNPKQGEQAIYDEEEDGGKKPGGGAKYSLKMVPPVEPSNTTWQRGMSTDEVQDVYPDLWNVAAEDADTRNPTQITSTVRTYRKIYDILKADGFDGKILDASSGLGYGTRAGIEEYGFDVEDIEPFPDKGYSPKYTDYSTLDEKYDAIISNAVLNVLPQEQRDALVVKMGEMLNPGGRIFVNVRSAGEITALQRAVDKKTGQRKNITLSDTEVAETTHGSYQKGFTKPELIAYLKDALGSEFDVKPTSQFGNVSAIVTKKAVDRGTHGAYTEKQQDRRVKKALSLIQSGKPGSEVFNQTGLFLMMNGDLMDPESKTVVWSGKNGGTKRTHVFDVVGAGNEGAETGISGNVIQGSSGGTGQKIRRAAPAWKDLTSAERRLVQDVLTGPNAVLRLRNNDINELFGGPEAFAEVLYAQYQKGNLAAEYYLGQYLEQPTEIIKAIDNALGRNADVNGSDGPYRLKDNTPGNWEVLSMAAEGVIDDDYSDAERDALGIFQRRLSTLTDLQARRAELGTQYKEQMFTKGGDRAAASETLDKMHALDERIEEAANAVTKVEQSRVVRDVLKRARKVVEKAENARMTELAKRARARQRERDAQSLNRARVEAERSELVKWMTSPDNKNVVKHVPEVVRKPVGDLLLSINAMSKRSLRGGEETVKDQDFKKSVQRLYDVLDDQMKDPELLYSGYMELPQDFMPRLKGFMRSIEGLAETGETYTLNNMSSEQLKELYHILRNVKKWITEMNRFHNNAMFRHVYEAGQDSIDSLDGVRHGATNAVTNAAYWNMMRPAYGWERFGTGGTAVYYGLRSGQGKLAYNVKELKDFAEKTYTAKEVRNTKGPSQWLYGTRINGKLCLYA